MLRSTKNCRHPAAALAVLLLLVACASAEDTVLLLSSDGRATVQRQGEIIDYTGKALRFKTAAGREESIPAQRVVEIKTTWAADHLIGREKRKSGRLEEAIEAYQQAKEQEQRPWARRQILSELAASHAELGRFDLAGDEFLRIVISDPTTQHFDVMPLPWRSFAPDAAIESRAGQWLAGGEKLPAAALLGASWLLSTERRGEAVAALERLSRARGQEDDVRLAMLADVQLWRTKLVTAKAADALRWQSAVEKMPAEIQGCGWFVVAEAHARLEQPEEAALAYLRVPLVHGRLKPMAAEALVAAGQQLEAVARFEQAANLYREVVRDHAASPAAAQAQTRLEALAGRSE